MLENGGKSLLLLFIYLLWTAYRPAVFSVNWHNYWLAKVQRICEVGAKSWFFIMQISETVRSVGDRRTVCLLRWEFINENKKVRIQENTVSTKKAIKKKKRKKDNGQEKKKENTLSTVHISCHFFFNLANVLYNW